MCPGNPQAHLPWCQQIYMAGVVLSSRNHTLGEKPFPLLNWGPWGQRRRRGQEHPRATTPGDSSCCPPAPVLQGKGGSSAAAAHHSPKNSLCWPGCPRTCHAAPLDDTSQPSSHPERHPRPTSLPRAPWELCRGSAPLKHPGRWLFSPWSSFLRKICLKKQRAKPDRCPLSSSAGV